MNDIVQKCLNHPPVDTKYVAGRWHHSRASLQGFITEARVHLATALQPKNRDVKKFLIICRARSGSTLTTQFLDAHPEITCHREVLVNNVVSPRKLLDRLGTKCRTPVYGCKFLSYQMIQVHRMSDPGGFLEQVMKDGYQLMHLERDTFQQTFSLFMAQTRKLYHQSDGTMGPDAWKRDKPAAAKIKAAELDVRAFVDRLEWSEMLLEYERFALKDLPHFKIDYDTDLKDAEAQKATALRIFDWLDLPPHDVPIAMKKVLSKNTRDMISNYDELADTMDKRGLSHLLPA